MIKWNIYYLEDTKFKNINPIMENSITNTSDVLWILNIFLQQNVLM